MVLCIVRDIFTKERARRACPGDKMKGISLVGTQEYVFEEDHRISENIANIASK